MIESICPKCHVPMNSPVCVKKSCGTKTIISTTLYWCSDCRIPIYEKVCPRCGNKGNYIATDLRPVFPEERLLLALVLEKSSPLYFDNKSVWHGNGAYIIDGKRMKISITALNRWSLDKIKQLKKNYDLWIDRIDRSYFDKNIDAFVEANKNHYNDIDDEAVRYIQKYKDTYAIEDMMVSFSGGKDSTVISHLVNKALGTHNIIHIFGDTTLEFPLTIEYKKRFKMNEESQGVRVLTAKNREKNFEDLCKVVGPPSRVMRWCCTVFKTGAIQKLISSVFKNKTNILTFYGIRRNESVSRSKYKKES